MIRPTAVSWRAAILYGVWAAICLMLTAGVVFGLLALGDGSEALRGIGYMAMIAPAAALIACVGWRLLHRGGRKAGWIGYVALAVGVVFVTHVAVAAAALSDSISEVRADPASILTGSVLAILLHGWITLPVALVGTGLFVWWQRRIAV